MEDIHQHRPRGVELEGQQADRFKGRNSNKYASVSFGFVLVRVPPGISLLDSFIKHMQVQAWRLLPFLGPHSSTSVLCAF